MNKDRLYLVHILECIEKIEEYTLEGFAVFTEDQKTQDAVLRNLHTLSESSMRLSPEIQSRYPDVPWREMHGFRNVIVHDYLGLELYQIWEIIQHDLPPLKKNIAIMLDELPNS